MGRAQAQGEPLRGGVAEFDPRKGASRFSSYRPLQNDTVATHR